MKIIDLLNKIANGEEVPKKINYLSTNYIYDSENQIYYKENYQGDYSDLLTKLSSYKGQRALNDEVEIIEEDKKIEKFKDYIPIGLTSVGADFIKKDVFEALLKIGDKINEIIDYINKGDK